MLGPWPLLVLLAAAPAAAAESDPAPDEPDLGEGAFDPVSAPEPLRMRALPTATSEAEGLYVEFGRGIRLTDDDASFALTMRGRIQARAFAGRRGAPNVPLDIGFQARRVRLVFLGELVERDLQFYLQLGLAPDDLEPDRLIPLRDAVITWTGHRDLSVRLGQMKVNFSRERMISSSALQMVDRSIVNAELSLDRDVGVQLFSNDLFGLGERLAWQAGVYGGDGRNRSRLGPGLLYAVRLQLNPFGYFDDLFLEADLSRSPKPRLSLGLAGGLNLDTVRARSTHGAVLDRAVDTRHAAADVMFKVRGLSVQSEVLYRDVAPRDSQPGPVPISAVGAFVQAGYVLPSGVEVAGRWAAIEPVGPDAGAVGRTEWAGALGWYVQRHELKLQSDYTLGRGAVGGLATGRLDHLVRVQVQVFF
jgi:phosphate-selective porin OprO and OprP